MSAVFTVVVEECEDGYGREMGAGLMAGYNIDA
jgi:hypothetical protein